MSELQKSHDGELSVAVFPYLKDGENVDPLTEFHLPLPEVMETVNWEELFEVEKDNLRFHIHLHAQPYYIDEEHEGSKITHGFTHSI